MEKKGIQFLDWHVWGLRGEAILVAARKAVDAASTVEEAKANLFELCGNWYGHDVHAIWRNNTVLFMKGKSEALAGVYLFPENAKP